MNQTRNQISSPEVTVLVINIIIGAGLISIPSLLASSAGADGILAFIAASFITLISGILICRLVLRFPQQSLAEYAPQLVGKFFAWIISLFITIDLLFRMATVLRTFSESVSVFLLPRTPSLLIMVTMMFAAGLLARNGLAPVTRSCGIIVFFFFFHFLLVPFVIGIFDFGEFLPLFQTDWQSFAESIRDSIITLGGFDVLLIIGLNVTGKKKLLKNTLIGITTASLITLSQIVLTFGTLSVSQTAKVQAPILETIKYMPVPTLLLERVDIFFFGIWIAGAYSTILIFLFTVAFHLSKVFKLKKGDIFVWPCAIVTCILANISPNYIVSANLSALTGYSLMVLTFGIVPLLLILSRKKSSKPGK